VVDNLGKVLTDFSFDRKIKGEQTLVHLIGPTADIVSPIQCCLFLRITN